MVYSSEKEMYPPVCKWLTNFLRGRHRKAQIRVFDTSKKSLARLIDENSLSVHLAPEWRSWDIFVDIVGFIITAKTTELAFIECKNVPITLDHLSQILGYSRVAQPRYSFITAPQGVSGSLKTLLLTFNRTDILEYHYQPGNLPRSIMVTRWDETSQSIDTSSLITGDREHLGTF
jgi:hypothetical protein